MKKKSMKKPMKSRLAEVEHELNVMKKSRSEPQEWKAPGGWNRKMKASKKKNNVNRILFIYMRKNGRIEPPKLLKYDDDVIVYNYKAFQVDPRAVWDWGKFKVYFYKEMDRRPVSNLNYKLIKQRGDLTDGDEILIKATMRAIQAGNSKQMSKGAMIALGIGALVFIAFMMSGGAGGAG